MATAIRLRPMFEAQFLRSERVVLRKKGTNRVRALSTIMGTLLVISWEFPFKTVAQCYFCQSDSFVFCVCTNGIIAELLFIGLTQLTPVHVRSKKRKTLSLKECSCRGRDQRIKVLQELTCNDFVEDTCTENYSH